MKRRIPLIKLRFPATGTSRADPKLGVPARVRGSACRASGLRGACRRIRWCVLWAAARLPRSSGSPRSYR